MVNDYRYRLKFIDAVILEDIMYGNLKLHSCKNVYLWDD